MDEWTFRVFGEPVALDADEQQDVLSEIARLRALMRGPSVARVVRVNQNPAGLVGDYASLLIEATIRGFAPEAVIPAAVQQRYGGCHWFAVSLEVLTAFSDEWAAMRAEDTSSGPAPPCESS